VNEPGTHQPPGRGARSELADEASASRQSLRGARLLAREQAARSNAELRAVQRSLAAEVGAAIAGPSGLAGMLQRCAEAMARPLRAACAGIWTVSDAHVLTLRARAGECRFTRDHERVLVGSHKVGRIAQDLRPHLTNQLRADPLNTDPGWAKRNRLTAFAGYPLVVEGRLAGVMGIYATKPLPTQVLDAMDGVADMIATGIERKRVEKERRRLAALERPARAEADREIQETQTALSLALEDSYRFVSVVEGSSEFMGIATLERQLVFVNSAGQKLVGIHGPAAARRMTIFDHVFPEDHALAREVVAGAVADGQRTGEIRFRNVDTGKPIPVWANFFVLRDRQTDRPVALATVAHDLTQEKRDLELRERVLGIVSHDLRNPLNAIMMGASVLRREPRAPAGTIRVAERILSSAERMDAIIGDLLDLTKVRLGGGIEIKREPIDAHELSARIIDELRAGYPGREVRLSVDGDGNGRWDASRLEQVVSNLASNALQHGPQDQPVTVESRGNDEEWILSVHNLGEPIAPDLLPYLFDPFRRGTGTGDHNGRGHLGLGLFIARAVVEAHGGSIDVTSRRGEGTRFSVRLPRFTQV